jgi:hypothetical protein
MVEKFKISALIPFLILTSFSIGILSSSLLLGQEEAEEKKTILELEKEDENNTGLNEPQKPVGEGQIGTNTTTPQQDSNYAAAMKRRVPILSRLEMDIKEFAIAWNIEQELMGKDIWSIARENTKIPAEILMPLGTEVVHHELMIENALNVPYMRSRILNGLSVSTGDIAQFLGLAEDTSPTITFELDFTDEVEIKIYSIQAIAIATLFHGPKSAGKHRMTWNLRDSKGRKMPSGDYIVEVRIGQSRVIRKRIVID